MVNVKCVFRGLRSRGRFSSSAGANKRKCGDSKGSQVSERCCPVNVDTPSPHPLAPCPPIRPRHSILLVFSEAGWYSSKTCRAVHAPEKVAIHLVPALCWHLETFTKNVQAAIFAENTGEASVWTFRGCFPLDKASTRFGDGIARSDIFFLLVSDKIDSSLLLNFDTSTIAKN